MKKLITIFALFSSALFANATSGVVLFSDNFANSSAWNITSGDLIVSNNIASTEGDQNMTEAYANFSQVLGPGDVLQLAFKSNAVTNFATNGWAGVSLYTGGTEQVFIGSPGNISSWGLDGPVFGSAIALSNTSPNALIKFTYDYDTGDWTIDVSGETASGTIDPNLAFDKIRIGADINNLADIAISNLSVATNSGIDNETACAPFTWIDGNTYTSNNNSAVYTFVGAAANGGDSIVTLNLNFLPTFQFGAGTSSNPYLISSKADLKLLSETPCYWDKYFKQTADIKFTAADFVVGGDFYNAGQGFIPIGNFISMSFTGTYDGGGHTIDSLYINRPTTDGVGLFGQLNGTLNNLVLKNVSITGQDYVGGIAGVSSGLISHCSVEVNLSGGQFIGGITGGNLGSISYSTASGTINASDYAGGLMGYLTTSTGYVSFSYATANVTVTGSGAGGLVARINLGFINDCYATGNVNGDSYVGGLVGRINATSSGVTNCYSTGAVNGNTNIGGFVGFDANNTGTNSFWDTQTSGQATSVDATGETTVQMQTQSTFTTAGWDFVGETTNGTNDSWLMPSCTDGNYPIFAWQVFSGSTGTSPDTFLISTKADLKTLSENSCLWALNYKQTADIFFAPADFQAGGDFYNSGMGFSPIGNFNLAFQGSYNGDKHFIRGLTINRPDSAYVGFFGRLGTTNAISGLGLDSVSVSGLGYVGALIGNISFASGGISDCWSSGHVVGSNSVGGLIGVTNGAAVSRCYSTTDVTATNASVGGLIGSTSGPVSDCYATGTISGGSSAGGLCGASSGVVSNCYATGNVSGNNSVGGLIGYFRTVNNSYAVGHVSGNSNVGGLVGRLNTFFGGTVNNCFWDTLTAGVPGNSYGTGLPTAQMNMESTFTNATWDFVNETANGTNDIWQMGGCFNNAYPVFSWQSALAIPLITYAPGTTSCGDGSIPLYATAGSGTVVWYADQTGGSSLATGNYFTTPFINTTTSYWVQAEDQGCTSPTRTEVIVTIAEAFPGISSLNAGVSELCDSGATTVILPTSSTEHFYYLRNYNDNSTIDGPIAGSGGTLTFNTGVISSTTTYNIYSVKDFGINLPAADDHVRFTSPFSSYGNAITIESWVKITNGEFPWAGQSTSEVDNVSGNVWLWHSGTFYVSDNGSWVSLAFPAVNDGWMHIATVADPSGLYIYYNGVLVASNASGITTGVFNNSSSVIELGQDPRFPDNSGRNSNVAFDNFRIWKSARSASDIASNKNNCDFNADPNLVLNVRFEDGTGTAITSQLGPNGLLMNPTSNWIKGSEACYLCAAYSQPVTVTVNSTPAVDTLSNMTACDSLALSGLSNGDYFTLSNGNGTALFAGDQITSSQALYVYAANGSCKSETSFSVTINATPDTATSVNGATITSAANAVSYQWIDCNNANAPINGETNQSFTATADGNYAVIVDNGNCTDTSACVAIIGLSSKENTSLSEVSVYPNPTAGKFIVSLPRQETVTVALKNVLGQVLETRIVNNSKQIELNISDAAGVYFLEITSQNNRRSVIRVVKE